MKYKDNHYDYINIDAVALHSFSDALLLAVEIFLPRPISDLRFQFPRPSWDFK